MTGPSSAVGIGIATFSNAGDGSKILDSWFPQIALDDEELEAIKGLGIANDAVGTRLIDPSKAGASPVASSLARAAEITPDFAVRRELIATFSPDLSAPPIDAHDVYLRLHLLSSRRAVPHSLNLDGQFGLLANVVWTNLGPADPDTFEADLLRVRARGQQVEVWGIDKFPRMTQYVIPTGVRIADASRVRLGAHLAEGTTVMHEGFVNFNAGTLGPVMVEGRISAGVVVGANSDIGGGASIMGTLSGGGKQVITIGTGALLGANAGIGISLGDESVVEAGLYVTAGTRVTLPDGEVVKAKELSGRPGLMFIRNSESGAVEVRQRQGSWGSLNEALHSN